MDPHAFDTARRAFEAGLAAQQAGRLAEAEAQYRASLAALPGRPSTLANLGATLLALGRADEALPLLRQACTAAPTHAEAWGHQGEALLALARPAEALAVFEALLALPSPPARAALRHAECLAGLSRLPEALAEAEALCAGHADWAEAWLLAGSLHKDLGQLDAALAALQRAAELDAQAGAEPGLAAWLLAGLRGARGSEVPPLPPPGYVEALFDSYAADFERHLDALEYRAPELLLTGLVGLARRRYATALDLGCGNGLVGRLVRPLVDRLEGLDLSSAMLSLAREAGHYDALHQAELLQHLQHLQQLAPASVDLLLAADVFIYLGDLDAVMAAARRVLAPGGVLAFTVEEAPANAGVLLHAQARYAHSARHLEHLARRHGFADAHPPLRATLRLEQRRPVAGLVCWWSAPPAPGA
jgi:predicted TPR repeat methyltransferase